MQPNKTYRQRSFLCLDLLAQLNSRNHLLGLAKIIPWQVYEDNFRSLYDASGRPGTPVQLMIGLFILMQLKMLSDERVVEVWVHNPWMRPSDPSEMAYFRLRIVEDGARKFFDISLALHVEVDSTIQVKNITLPTNAKLLTKILTRGQNLANQEDIKLRCTSLREIDSLLQTIRPKSKGRRLDKSHRTARRLRTIAGSLVRELTRKHSPEALAIHQQAFILYKYGREHRQQRIDNGKMHSLQASDVYCFSKGKAHKKYEFATKVAVTVTKTVGIIVVTLSYPDNSFDGQTLPAVLSPVESIMRQRPTMGICDQKYRGRRKIVVTSIEIPESGKRAKTASDNLEAGEEFCRSAAIDSDLRTPHERPHDAVQLPQRQNRRRYDPVHGLRCVKFPKIHPDTVLFATQIAWDRTSNHCSASTNLYVAGCFNSISGANIYESSYQ